MATQVLRQVFGIDPAPRAMTPQEAQQLQDDFAQLVLAQAPAERPLNLAAVTDLIKQGSSGATPQVFLVGEGSQIPWDSDLDPTLDRSFRFIWVRSANGSATPGSKQMGDIMIVAGPDSSSNNTFLQAAVWDPHNMWFNYYERQGNDWVWNGNSTYAFKESSRNQGPFMGHINGSLVMKELKSPWNNWHSSKATINVPNDNPLSRETFFKGKSFANDLERLVEGAIDAWTDSRLGKALGPKDPGNDGKIKDLEMGAPKMLLQHLFTSTTANLVSSSARSKPSVPPFAPISLPLSFFLNVEGLSMPALELKADFRTKDKYAVPYIEVYNPALQELGIHLQGTNSNGQPVRIPTDETKFRDTFFAFLVPEFAYEDFAVVNGLLDRGVLSKRFVLASWMVDFCNPVYSPHRLALMEYVPVAVDSWRVLEEQTVQAILQGADKGDADALEFKHWWDLGMTGYDALADAAAKAINDYLKQVDQKCRDPAGFVRYMRLADWRRRAFVGHNRPLDEFELTLPRSNILTATPLEMDPTGDIKPMPLNLADTLIDEAKDALRSGSRLKCQANRCGAQCPLQAV